MCSQGKGTRDEEGELTTAADSWAAAEREELLVRTQGLLIPVFLKCLQIEGFAKGKLFSWLGKTRQDSEDKIVALHWMLA